MLDNDGRFGMKLFANQIQIVMKKFYFASFFALSIVSAISYFPNKNTIFTKRNGEIFTKEDKVSTIDIEKEERQKKILNATMASYYFCQ